MIKKRKQALRPTSRPRLADVAALCGVSVTAASDILNRQSRCFANAATRKRVFAAARELGYRPNALARNLRRQRTHSCGLVFPGMLNEYIVSLVDVIHKRAGQSGYRTIMEPFQGTDPADHVELVGELAANMVEGIYILQPTAHRMVPWHFEADLALSVVLIDTDQVVNAPAHADRVAVDRSVGVCEAVTHLLAQGRRRIVIVVPDVAARGDLLMAGKVNGWARAYEQAGLEVRRDLIVYVSNPEEWTIQQGLELGRRILASKMNPDAIVANNDFTAIGLIKAFWQAGVRVPDDVAVVGFNNFNVCEMPPVELASIGFPVPRIAEEAVRMMVERLEGQVAADHPGRTVTVETRFVRRASSG